MILHMNIQLRLHGIRGAACAENTAVSIQDAVAALYTQLSEKNGITEENIVSVIFSVTKDLTALNPASALRKAGFCSEAALFCCQEAEVDGALRGVIRVLIHCYTAGKTESVYIRGAEILRPDLAGDNT